MRTDRLILGTVNAPWKRDISAATLAACIKDGSPDDWLSHIVTFFTEVDVDLVFEFAQRHTISACELSATYFSLKTSTGERNLALEERFGAVGIAP